MNPKTAAQWIDAHLTLSKMAGIPPIVRQDVAKKYQTALRKARPAKARIRLPRGSKAKAKLPPIPKLKKELDRVFSLFIRQRDASPYSDHGKCCTCSHVAHWKDMDCGHYVPRQDLATRWDERNCHLQCKACNGFRGGEPEKMAAYIDHKYVKGASAALREKGRQPFKLHRPWLTEQIAKYKALIGERSEPGERLRDPAPSPVTPPSPQPKDQP